jgi:hypothetical protein
LKLVCYASDRQNDPLRGLQRRFVSNSVSNTEKLVRIVANIGGQEVLRFRENWTSESTGEQELWA